MVRVVVCDDQQILVDSLALALRKHGLEVLAAVATPAECLRAVAGQHPEVCLLDLYLPRPDDGLDTARAILAGQVATEVLILSGVANPQMMSKAIDAGVAGIIRKDQTVDKIAAAIRQVARHEPAFQTDLIRDVVRHLAAQPRKEPWDYLTAREREVLRRIAAGESTKQMARSMLVAASTVRTYAQNVLTKLGVHSRLEAAAIAAREDLGDEPWDDPGPPA